MFPRIAEKHPLAEAARVVNAVAEERGLDAALEWLGIKIGPGELAYLAEQRALRAVAAAGLNLNLGTLGKPFDDQVAAAILRTPLWRDEQMLLVGLHMDGVVIGWKGRELASPGEAPRDAIGRVVDYLWSVEERDYKRSVHDGDVEEGSPYHVFTDLQRLAEWLEASGPRK